MSKHDKLIVVDYPDIDGWKSCPVKSEYKGKQVAHWIYNNKNVYIAFLSPDGNLSIRIKNKRSDDGRGALKSTSCYFNARTQLKQAVTLAYLLSQQPNF